MIDFIKMQACGNDYIYLDCLGGGEPSCPEALARRLSARNFSVGGDGLVLILPSDVADAKMRIFNADGSEGAICGNALRCVALLLYESNYARRSRIKIETACGVRCVLLSVKDGKVVSIGVEMGKARNLGTDILEACGEKYELVEIDVGNRHAVIFCPDADVLDIAKIGAAVGAGKRDEGGINVELCEIGNDNELRVRVLERGSGETLSCGSGACACAAAAVIRGYASAQKPIKVKMRGGELSVRCTDELEMRLTGGAERVFEGRADIPEAEAIDDGYGNGDENKA